MGAFEIGLGQDCAGPWCLWLPGRNGRIDRAQIIIADFVTIDDNSNARPPGLELQAIPLSERFQPRRRVRLYGIRASQSQTAGAMIVPWQARGVVANDGGQCVNPFSRNRTKTDASATCRGIHSKFELQMEV